jgi:putative membrane protein
LEAPGLVSRASDRSFFVVNALVSAAALGVLYWLLVARHVTGGAGGTGLSALPAINATLNATSALLLATGWVAIRRGARRAHAWLMVSAFASSAAFLVCYLVYHYVHGDTRFGGHGALRTAYLIILATHVTLSMAVVPLALTAFWFAARRAFVRHKRVTRFLLPIWLYVSVTGVVVYWMLYQLPH